jgi:hypothetical protein
VYRCRALTDIYEIIQSAPDFKTKIKDHSGKGYNGIYKRASYGPEIQAGEHESQIYMGHYTRAGKKLRRLEQWPPTNKIDHVFMSLGVRVHEVAQTRDHSTVNSKNH